VFGILKVGAATMNLKTGSQRICEDIQAMIILFVSTPGIVMYIKKYLQRTGRKWSAGSMNNGCGKNRRGGDGV
jgi:ABC-type uncharacterized transport system permease subunit